MLCPRLSSPQPLVAGLPLNWRTPAPNQLAWPSLSQARARARARPGQDKTRRDKTRQGKTKKSREQPDSQAPPGRLVFIVWRGLHLLLDAMPDVARGPDRRLPCRPQAGSQASMLSSSQAARQPGSQAARQPGSQAARQPGSRPSRTLLARRRRLGHLSLSLSLSPDGLPALWPVCRGAGWQVGGRVVVWQRGLAGEGAQSQRDTRPTGPAADHQQLPAGSSQSAVSPLRPGYLRQYPDKNGLPGAGRAIA